MSILITLLLGLFFLIGMIVVLVDKNSKRIEHYSIAVALGAMVGIGVLDLLPEIIETTPASKFYLPIIGTIAGFFLLVILDRFIPEHEDEDDDEYSEENMVHIGMISCIAIVIHNIIEGMAVYSLAMQELRQGILLMIGVGLHNIPMGMFIYSTLKSKKGIKKYIFFAMTVMSTFIGGLFMMGLAPYFTVSFDIILYGIALGMILYIVIMELLPYVKRNSYIKTSIIGGIIGLAIVFISVFLE